MMKIYRYDEVPLSELLIRSVDKSGVTCRRKIGPDGKEEG